jgi:hypothetical protein
MAQVKFKPTTPVLERAKTVHAIVCAATVIGNYALYFQQISLSSTVTFLFHLLFYYYFVPFLLTNTANRRITKKEKEPTSNYHVYVPRSQFRTQSVIIQICGIMYHVDRFK